MVFPRSLRNEPIDYGMIPQYVPRMPATPLRSGVPALQTNPYAKRGLPPQMPPMPPAPFAPPVSASQTPPQTGLLGSQSLGHGLLGMGAALMQASGPSYDPRSGSLGSAVGSGIQGMYQGLNQGMQLQEHQRVKDQRVKHKAALQEFAKTNGLNPSLADAPEMLAAAYQAKAAAALAAAKNEPFQTYSGAEMAAKMGIDMPSKWNGLIFKENLRTGEVSMVGGAGTTNNIYNDTKTGVDSFYGFSDPLKDRYAAAAGSLADVDVMEGLLESGIETGFGAEWATEFQKAAGAFGIAGAETMDNVALKEAFIAQTRPLILSKIKELGQNPTDADLKFLVEGSPGLTRTNEGNAMMLRGIKLKAQRDQLIVDTVLDWETDNIDLIQKDPRRAEATLRNIINQMMTNNPLWTNARQIILKGGAMPSAGNSVQQRVEDL